MPKGIPKKNTELEELTNAVRALTEKVQMLSPEVVPSAPAPEMRGGFPIPFEYQELVHTLLNKEFGVDIKYLPDTSSFEFTIIVPKKYSNAPQTHWDTYGADRRTKVIENAYGANGVREWVTKVYNNLPAETQALITYDRAQP